MKKILLSALAICAVLIIGYFVMHSKEDTVVEVPTQTDTNTNTKECFEYKQVATADAPYSVDETIEITKDGNNVSGTKRGTQAGPDMTNGYEGTLTGTLSGDTMNVIFSYVIEGSAQKEQEIYKIQADALVKQRYVLKEQGGVLVPDMTGSPKELVYSQVACMVK